MSSLFPIRFIGKLSITVLGLISIDYLFIEQLLGLYFFVHSAYS